MQARSAPSAVRAFGPDFSPEPGVTHSRPSASNAHNRLHRPAPLLSGLVLAPVRPVGWSDSPIPSAPAHTLQAAGTALAQIPADNPPGYRAPEGRNCLPQKLLRSPAPAPSQSGNR